MRILMQGRQAMATATMTPRRLDTVAKLVNHLGIPPERIRLFPSPGEATIDDALEFRRETGILCELVDGILVEKAMGYYESLVAAVLIGLLRRYLEEQGEPGFVLGESGMVWVEPDQMRMPDVSYISWDHFPGRVLPKGAV